MSTGVQRIFVWSGLAMLIVFFIGFWVVAGYSPPKDPHATVEEIVNFYSDNTTRIRVGLWITMYAAALCLTFFTAISIQMRRIEGPSSPLAWTQMLGGALFTIEFIFPLAVWQAAAYRPRMNPEITYRLHDLGWLMFLGIVSTTVLQTVVIAWAILRDTRPQPIIPRWVGYSNLWCGLLFTSGGMIYMFKEGPFAWNGIAAWWFVMVGFGIWVASLMIGLLKHAIPHQEREAAAAAQSSDTAAQSSAGVTSSAT